MFHIPRQVLDELSEDVGAPHVATLSVPEPWHTRDRIVEKLQDLMAEGIAARDPSDGLLYEHVMLGIAGHFATSYGGLREPAALSRGGLAPTQARKATELLAADLAGELRLIDVARECGLSVTHFGRAFKTTFGTTPHQWRQSRRIERTKHALLTSTVSLAELASASGFADQSHFNRVFVQHTGVTPAAWRRSEHRD